MDAIQYAKSCLAAAACASAALAVHATPVTANVGQYLIVKDPNGSGRAVQLTALNGSGTLAFSPGSGYDGRDPSTLGGLIGALNVGKVVLTAVSPATYRENSVVDEFGDVIRVGSAAQAPVTSVTMDNFTGQVLSVASAGGAQQVGTRISGTLNGGQATVTNLRFDLANKLVYADLVGRSAAVGTRPAVDYVSLNTALWTIGMISGPTTIPPSAMLAPDRVQALQAAGYTDVQATGWGVEFTATNVISGLKVTQAGFDFFRNSLGLLATGTDALAAVNNDPMGWGSVTSSIRFATSIPEPSTWATMTLGLAALGVAAARQRRHA